MYDVKRSTKMLDSNLFQITYTITLDHAKYYDVMTSIDERCRNIGDTNHMGDSSTPRVTHSDHSPSNSLHKTKRTPLTIDRKLHRHRCHQRHQRRQPSCTKDMAQKE